MPCCGKERDDDARRREPNKARADAREQRRKDLQAIADKINKGAEKRK